MRLGTVMDKEGPYIVALVGDLWFDLRQILPPGDARAREMPSLIASWHETAPILAEAIAAGSVDGQKERPEELLPPVTQPKRILCIGRNYAKHAIEQRAEVPKAPEIFMKLPSTLVGPYSDIVLPREVPEVDYEAELVVVIGRGGRRISRAQALEAVFGWTVGNDVSVRPLQHRGTQWTPGKNFDRTAPLGPYIVTRDELPDPMDCRVSSSLPEGEMQSGVVHQMLFDVGTLIEDISRFTTLEPGDLIFTGTPPGVGEARTPQRWLCEGDVLVSAVEGIGTLRNRCVIG